MAHYIFFSAVFCNLTYSNLALQQPISVYYIPMCSLGQVYNPKVAAYVVTDLSAGHCYKSMPQGNKKEVHIFVQFLSQHPVCSQFQVVTLKRGQLLNSNQETLLWSKVLVAHDVYKKNHSQLLDASLCDYFVSCGLRVKLASVIQS